MDNKNFKKTYTNYSNARPVEKPMSPVANESIVEETSQIADEKIEEPIAVTEAPIENVNDIAQVVDRRIVIPALLNVRVAPNASANIVRTVPSGEEVNVLEYVDGYARIGDNEYVNVDFLK